MNLNIPSSITKINSDFLDKNCIELFIKRDDTIHKIISGNKWRKLKYNFEYATKNRFKTVLSFGGTYSNHLHALSYLARKKGFNSVGVVRGPKNEKLNPTLSFCKKNGMYLYYLDRVRYRSNKYDSSTILNLKNKFGNFFLIPEGGNNLLGVKGCEEIVKEIDLDFDYFCSPVGTGCTAAGIIKTLNSDTFFLGFCPFQKIHEQKKNINDYCDIQEYNNWRLFSDSHFGGFTKINDILIKFIRQFNFDYNIQLDLIYMGKLFFHLFDLIEKGFFFRRTRICVLHTGGLQGLQGFNFRFE